MRRACALRASRVRLYLVRGLDGGVGAQVWRQVGADAQQAGVVARRRAAAVDADDGTGTERLLAAELPRGRALLERSE